MAKKQSNNSEEQLYYHINGIDLKFLKNWMPICNRCVNASMPQKSRCANSKFGNDLQALSVSLLVCAISKLVEKNFLISCLLWMDPCVNSCLTW